MSDKALGRIWLFRGLLRNWKLSLTPGTKEYQIWGFPIKYTKDNKHLTKAKELKEKLERLKLEPRERAVAVAITRKYNKWIDTYLAIIEVASKPYIDYNTRLWDEPAKRYWSPHPYMKPRPLVFYYPVRIKFKIIKILEKEGISTTIVGITPTQEDSIYGKSIYLLKDSEAERLIHELLL